MITFHGDAQLKADLVDEIRKHQELDQIVQGTYGEQNGLWRGCAVGCAIHSLNLLRGHDYGTYRHDLFETEFGIPIQCVHLMDRIFEGLPDGDFQNFPLRVIEAIPVGADLSHVAPAMMVFILNDCRPSAFSDGQAAIDQCIGLWQRRASGETVPANEWAAAESAKYAAESASAAARAARAAARAARAAGSDAWPAGSAAESAGSAAESAAWKRFADEFVRLLSAFKSPGETGAGTMNQSGIQAGRRIQLYEDGAQENAYPDVVCADRFDRERQEATELVTEEHCRKWKLPLGRSVNVTWYLLGGFGIGLRLFNGKSAVCYRGEIIIENPTISQVRHLAAELGMELKEESAGETKMTPERLAEIKRLVVEPYERREWWVEAAILELIAEVERLQSQINAPMKPDGWGPDYEKQEPAMPFDETEADKIKHVPLKTVGTRKVRYTNVEQELATLRAEVNTLDGEKGELQKTLDRRDLQLVRLREENENLQSYRNEIDRKLVEQDQQLRVFRQTQSANLSFYDEFRKRLFAALALEDSVIAAKGTPKEAAFHIDELLIKVADLCGENKMLRRAMPDDVELLINENATLRKRLSAIGGGT